MSTFLAGGQLMMVHELLHELTVSVWVADLVQPFTFVTVYVIKCEPMPAVAALKIPPEMPGPAYVPPVGVPPVSGQGGSVKQNGAKAANAVSGNAKTVMVFVIEQVQPLLFVAVYAMMCVPTPATEGVKMPFETPVPA